MKQHHSYHGKLFVLEGLDGSGKTSLLKSLISILQHRFPRISILSAKEPGHTRLGEDIRNLLLCPNRIKSEDPTSLTECLLFNAARSQLVETFLKPELQQGSWIFLDRFTLSSYAYQGASKNIQPDFLHRLIQEASQNLLPDVTLFLNAPWNLCKKRLQDSAKASDRMENSSDQFFERVYDCYFEEIKKHRQNVLILDAQLPKKELILRALGALEPYFETKKSSNNL